MAAKRLAIVAAINISGEGQSTLGPIRLEVLSEFVLDDAQGSIIFCALPDGSPGIQLAQILGSSVIQARRGDLVTAEVVEGTGCFSLETCLDDANEIQPGCITSTHIRFEITGGTGGSPKQPATSRPRRRRRPRS